MTEHLRYSEALPTTVARVIVFVPACALVLLSGDAFDTPSAIALPIACVLLGIVADGAVAWLGGARRRMLGRAIGGNVMLWAALVVLALLLNGADPRPDGFDVLGGLLLFFGALVACISLLPKPQAFVAWALGSAAGAVTIANPMFMYGFETSNTTLHFAVAGLLTAGSIGTLSLYARRAIAQRRGLKLLVQRLGLVAMAVGLSVAVSTAATVFVSQSAVSTHSVEQFLADRANLQGVSRQLSALFPEPDFATPSPALADELARYASLLRVGLTVYETGSSSVVLAIRSAPSGSGWDDPYSVQPMSLTPAEVEEIGRTVAAGSTELPQAGMLGGRSPSWTPLGYRDGNAHPDPAIESTASTFSAPDGKRFALVLTDARFDWMSFPGISVSEVSTGYANLVTPWLFLAFMLPCTLGLLALDRRDAARERVSALEERARLNRDAHDRVYNRLTALANRLEATQPEGLQPPAPADEIRATVADLQTILGDGILAERFPTDDAAAVLLADVCDERARSLGIDIELVGAEALRGLDPRLGWELHCVATEALTNAGLHGHATRATVAAYLADGVLRIAIADDGSGMSVPVDDKGSPTGGSGMRGMRERVEALGGQFAIESGSGGTTVTAAIPLDRR